MTAQRLKPTTTESPRYAVVGSCTAEHAVFHVGILECACSIAEGQEVAVFHMANAISGMEMPGNMKAHAVGWIDELSTEEYGRIEDWLNELKTTTIKIEYIGFPAAEIETDKVTRRPIGRKFSCAGFVHSCFKEALGIELVAEEDLPEVGLDLLKRVWGPIVETRRGQRHLRGPGPWRVLLPSYLFHALARERSGMPHRPLQAIPCFPPAAQEHTLHVPEDEISSRLTSAA